MGVMVKDTPKKQSPGVPNINWKQLIKFCRMKTASFEQFGKRFNTPNGPYFYRDNGSNILAVAHLDYIGGPTHTTTCTLADDTLFFSPVLDDRAGVYAILDYLDSVGLKFDILLTTGEEKQQSSALFFEPSRGKKYNWMFSFDRAGTDAVMYGYKDDELTKKLKEAGWTVGIGTYSDIDDMEHLRCKGVNFGVGYYAQHTTRCHLSRRDFLANMRKFIRFYNAYVGVAMPHTPMYNQYTAEDGFSWVYKPKAVPFQDTFTESDIEVIEILEREGFEFGSRVTPQDMDSIIQTFRERNGLSQALGLKDKQISLPFPEKELKLETMPLQRGSEDNPEYQGNRQPRKAADLIKEVDEVVTSIHHAGREGKSTLHQIKAEAEENGIATIMMDECTTCHKTYETTIDKSSTQCPDCRGEVKDVTAIEVKEPELVLTGVLTLFRPGEKDARYKYEKDEGKGWCWVHEHQAERVAA